MGKIKRTLRRSALQGKGEVIQSSISRSKNVTLKRGKFNSLVEDICKRVKAQKTMNSSKTDTVNVTIDLSDDDSNTENENLRITIPNDSTETDEVLILSNSTVCTSKEVIDLTGNIPNSTMDETPTVIDISEDDVSRDRQNGSNDEIYVITTFKRDPQPSIKLNFESSYIPLSIKSENNVQNTESKKKCKKKNKKNRKRVQNEINFSSEIFCKTLEPNPTLAGVGENIYFNSLTVPTTGLRPVMIDGNNVAFDLHGRHHFSSKKLEICIKYFKEKGHKVTAFVPQFRIRSNGSDDPHLLQKLEKQGDLVLTPSKQIDGKSIVPYDDRFIVQAAVLKGGVIVSRDNYNDLLRENPAWAETIKYRTLQYTWVDDVLMFPKDPLGVNGPSLEQFLRF